MEATRDRKYIRISPRKMRRSVDLIRGGQVDEARRVLRFSPLGAAQALEKVLNSAVANAEQRPASIAGEPCRGPGLGGRGADAEAVPARGPTGRATQIRKRTCHVTVVVETMGEESGGTQG